MLAWCDLQKKNQLVAVLMLIHCEKPSGHCLYAYNNQKHLHNNIVV